MQNINYTISYNKQIQMLEFSHEMLPDNGYRRPLARLFNDFGYNITNIILDSHKLAVCLVSKYESDAITNAIAYDGDVQCNEHITDILFLHGEYSDYKNHYPGFLSQEQFSLWQKAIKNSDKPAILKMLYQDNKISRAYLLKYSNHPASLYDLGKYNLLDNFFGRGAIQAKKIDELILPLSIKEDLKHSFAK